MALGASDDQLGVTLICTANVAHPTRAVKPELRVDVEMATLQPDVKPLAERRRPASKPFSLAPLAALAHVAANAEPAPTPARNLRSPPIATPQSAMLGRLADSFTSVTLRSAPSAAPSPTSGGSVFLAPRSRASVGETTKTPMSGYTAWSPYSAQSSLASGCQSLATPAFGSALGSPVRLYVPPSAPVPRSPSLSPMSVDSSPEPAIVSQVPISRHVQRRRESAGVAPVRHHPYRAPATPTSSMAPPAQRRTVACPPAPVRVLPRDAELTSQRRSSVGADALKRPRARSSPGPNPLYARRLDFSVPALPSGIAPTPPDSPIAIASQVIAPPTPMISRTTFLSPMRRPSPSEASQARRDELARLRARVDELERLEDEAIGLELACAGVGGQLGMRRGRDVRPLRLA